jgi:hypothetical protein
MSPAFHPPIQDSQGQAAQLLSDHFSEVIKNSKSRSGSMTMASNQSFSRIQRRISLSPEPQSPLESGEPSKMMAMRLPPFSGD